MQLSIANTILSLLYCCYLSSRINVNFRRLHSTSIQSNIFGSFRWFSFVKGQIVQYVSRSSLVIIQYSTDDTVNPLLTQDTPLMSWELLWYWSQETCTPVTNAGRCSAPLLAQFGINEHLCTIYQNLLHSRHLGKLNATVNLK